MKPRQLNPEIIDLYAKEVEHVVVDREPLLFEAETEAGTVRFKYSVREWNEDEITVRYPTDEPGVFKEVTVFRDNRPHLAEPTLTANARTVESRYDQAGAFKDSVTRLATIGEIADALTTARDLFREEAFMPKPVGPGQR